MKKLVFLLFVILLRYDVIAQDKGYKMGLWGAYDQHPVVAMNKQTTDGFKYVESSKFISTVKNSSLNDDTKFVPQLGMSITQDSDSVYFDLNVYVNTVDASSVYIYKDSPILIKLSDGEIIRFYCNKDVKDNIGTVFSATYNIIRYSVIANYRITPKDILKFKKGITKIRLEVNAEKCDMEFKKYKNDELGQFLLSAYSLVSQTMTKQTDFEEGF